MQETLLRKTSANAFWTRAKRGYKWSMQHEFKQNSFLHLHFSCLYYFLVFFLATTALVLNSHPSKPWLSSMLNFSDKMGTVVSAKTWPIKSRPNRPYFLLARFLFGTSDGSWCFGKDMAMTLKSVKSWANCCLHFLSYFLN